MLYMVAHPCLIVQLAGNFPGCKERFFGNGLHIFQRVAKACAHAVGCDKDSTVSMGSIGVTVSGVQSRSQAETVVDE